MEEEINYKVHENPYVFKGVNESEGEVYINLFSRKEKRIKMISGSVSYQQFIENCKAQPFKVDHIVIKRKRKKDINSYCVTIGSKNSISVPIIPKADKLTYSFTVDPKINTRLSILLEPKEEIIIMVYFRMYQKQFTCE